MIHTETTTRVTCDRCGKDIKPLMGFFKRIRFDNPKHYCVEDIDIGNYVDVVQRDSCFRISEIRVDGMVKHNRIDLCGDCNREFKAFLKNPKN